ncbi:hypothetical protein LOAG_18721 [Loa loa]|uniref:Uncharacterized protein n=1 Tax=Loa loa TaxID=7209 RepID=A0A1S0UE73_LOALO|nr:hypothetical protein LOAG_18721 [Loa loa]EJD73889.1 hypothetical protein LOAG_18721 [Loa loa]
MANDIKAQQNEPKMEMANDIKGEQNEPKITSIITDNSITNSNDSLKFETFRQIELPAVKPDSDGICHYSIIVEFEAPKELLFSNKPKHIGLQLEAILEC